MERIQEGTRPSEKAVTMQASRAMAGNKTWCREEQAQGGKSWGRIVELEIPWQWTPHQQSGKRNANQMQDRTNFRGNKESNEVVCNMSKKHYT